MGSHLAPQGTTIGLGHRVLCACVLGVHLLGASIFPAIQMWVCYEDEITKQNTAISGHIVQAQ
jgi:hypothetical protein